MHQKTKNKLYLTLERVLRINFFSFFFIKKKNPHWRKYFTNEDFLEIFLITSGCSCKHLVMCSGMNSMARLVPRHICCLIYCVFSLVSTLFWKTIKKHQIDGFKKNRELQQFCKKMGTRMGWHEWEGVGGLFKSKTHTQSMYFHNLSMNFI